MKYTLDRIFVSPRSLVNNMNKILGFYHVLEDNVVRQESMSNNGRLCFYHALEDDALHKNSFDGTQSRSFVDKVCGQVSYSDTTTEGSMSGSSINSLDEFNENSLDEFNENGSFSENFPCEGRKQGEVILRGHRKYELMLSLQLGIRYAVGRITPEPKRNICSADFGLKARICMTFPREASAFTPSHKSFEFKWEDYCPLVFRHLRELFNIDAADYVLSVCGNDALREFSSPGKSGSVFYLSYDERFMIKTMRKSEVKVLLRMLPNYYNHVLRNQNTLLTRFFGVHDIKPSGGRKVHFVVMHNIFYSDRHIHRRFDLKGSSQGRSVNKVDIDETTTLKDLDLNFEFYLEPSLRTTLVEQIEQDCKLLADEKIMDYSLLLGVHIQSFPPHTTFSRMPCKFSINDEHNRKGIKQNSVDANGNNSVPNSTTTSRQCVQLGTNMPAKAVQRQSTNRHGYQQLLQYDAVLYFGIIDILQGYDMSKKLEHAYKSFQFDAFTISAIDPKEYSRRFQEFIHENNRNDMKQDSAETNAYNSVRDTPIKARPSIRFGTNMTARAVPKQTTNTRQGLQQPVEYDVVLYFAIIDRLQGYDMSKKAQTHLQILPV